MDHPDNYAVFGIEKPFPWVAALSAGLLGGLVLTALLNLAFVRGSWPVDQIIEGESLFHF